jgi:branched-chain amino acid transport system substrate-binding protein
MAVLLTSGCSVMSPEHETEVVRIAADLELSGDGAALGATFRNALELRVEQVNRQRFLGNRRLELVIEDNRTDAAVSTANIERWAADESITAIITGGCAECLLASVDTINDAGVPTISLAAPDDIATPVDERRYVFKLGPNPQDTSSVLAAELNRAGVRTVAIVAGDDTYGADGLTEMIAATERVGIEVVLTELLHDDAETLRGAANRIVEWEPEPATDFGTPLPPPADDAPMTGPDAVIVWTFAPIANRLAVDLRAQGYRGGLYLDMAAADNLFLTGQTAQALAGATMIFTETLVIDEVIATSPAKTARKSWFNDYSARYGTYHAFASFAADAVDLIVRGVNKTDSADREALRAAFESTQMDGLTGPLRITPDNHSGLTALALTVLVAQGDRWRLAH